MGKNLELSFWGQQQVPHPGCMKTKGQSGGYFQLSSTKFYKAYSLFSPDSCTEGNKGKELKELLVDVSQKS